MSRIQIKNLMSSDLVILHSQDSGKVFGGRHGGDDYGFDDHGGRREDRDKFHRYPYNAKREYEYEYEYEDKYKPAKKHY
jgi:hypothetical protein